MVSWWWRNLVELFAIIKVHWSINRNISITCKVWKAEPEFHSLERAGIWPRPKWMSGSLQTMWRKNSNTREVGMHFHKIGKRLIWLEQRKLCIGIVKYKFRWKRWGLILLERRVHIFIFYGSPFPNSKKSKSY